MTTQAASGDTLAQVNEILDVASGETQDVQDKDSDDYTPDLENSGEAENDEDENLTDDSGEAEGEAEGEDDGLDSESEDDESKDTDEEENSDEEGESQDIENISQLADHLDAEESVIYSLEVPMGDGLEPVSISTLKDSYMSRERDQQKFAEDREHFDEAVRYYQNVWEENKKLPEFNQQVLTAATNVLAIEQADANFDWDALEKSDPTQAILQRQKLTDAHAQATQEYEAAKGILEQNRGKAFADMKTYEKAKTLEAIPEWSDPASYQKDADAMGPLLSEYGFNSEEIQNVYDHRLTRLVRDYMLLRAKEKDVNLTKKKLRIVPKKLSGKNTQNRKVGKSVALKRKLNAAKNSRDDRQKASAIADLLAT